MIRLVKRILCIGIAAMTLLLGFAGCKSKQNQEQAAAELQKKMSQSFETTAKVTYKGLESVMTIYKEPMNCALVTFNAPESLKNMKMTFYNDRVTLQYKDMSFDFVPDSVPGQAASKMVLSALNTALNDKGVSVRQEDNRLVIDGRIDAGTFSLVVDAENGNILKLSIPESELELEVLNFKILD